MSSQLHILFSINKVLRNKREARVDVNLMNEKEVFSFAISSRN